MTVTVITDSIMGTVLFLIAYALGVFVNICFAVMFRKAVKDEPIVKAIVTVAVLCSFVTWLTIAVHIALSGKNDKT